MPASRPAIAQMLNDTRPIGTPASWAASAFSADARLAFPSGLRLRYQVRARMHTGATKMIRSCPGPSTSEPTVSRQSNGTGNGLPVSSPPRGISRLIPKNDLGQPDRGDQHRQPRPARQRPDHERFDAGAEHHRTEQGERRARASTASCC